MANKSARLNNANKGTVDFSIYAQGAFKNVFKGRYTEGERAGQECVSKEFKSGSVYEASFFDHELKVIDKALELVNHFNSSMILSNGTVWLNKAEVWTYIPGSFRAGQKSLVEPLIPNFQKFNSNTGWKPADETPWVHVMQALSHFSYHVSCGDNLLCDLQGGICDGDFVLTDPVIMSTKRGYGPSDLGLFSRLFSRRFQGISTFFASHKCNKFCRPTWLAPKDPRSHFAAQEGTTMIVKQKPFYSILGVEKSASSDDIKHAYRKLAVQWHPDKNPHMAGIAHGQFIDINDAFNTLSDPDKRRNYDRNAAYGG